MRIRHFVDPGLGNSAYLLISETERAAVVIDPLRDVDQYLNVARHEGCASPTSWRRTCTTIFSPAAANWPHLPGRALLRARRRDWGLTTSQCATAMSSRLAR
jgi:hypothetical protein